MASEYSNLLRVELIQTGEQSGTWGTTTNTNLGTILEQAIAGTTSLNVTAGNVTLTTVNGGSDTSRSMIIDVTGTPGTTRNIVAPKSSKVYVVVNGSDAPIVFKGTDTTGVTVASGANVWVSWSVTEGDFVEIGASSEATGDVVGPASSTDSAVALFDGTSGKLLKVGGTFPSGNLVGTNDTQTLTNKTIDGNSNTVTNLSLSSAVSGTLGVSNGGTGVSSLTGLVKGNGGSAFSAATAGTDYVVPGGSLGTPTTGTLTNCTGLPLSTGITGFGTGVASALAIATGATGAFVVKESELGYPSSGTLANCTVDGTNSVGFRNIPPVGQKTTGYTLATGDVGKFVEIGSGGSITVPNATFASGDVVSIFNNTNSNSTVTCSITTAYVSGTDVDVSSFVIPTRGVATVLFISSTVCVITGSVT